MGLTDKIGKSKIGKGLALGAMLGASVLTSGCNQAYTNALSRNVGESYLQSAVVSSAQKRFGPEQGTNVVVNGENQLSPADVATLNEIRKMPRVLNLGDRDGDGDLDWAYYDGKGHGYEAQIGFKGYNGKYNAKRTSYFNEKHFVYFVGEKPHDVPKDALIIWYKDPTLKLD